MRIGGPSGPEGPDKARGAKAPKAGRPSPDGTAAASANAPDEAAVLGIPEAEFTPKVRAAIMTLMAEVDRLRIELDRAERRIAELEGLADHDPMLPVLNRRAFVRELARAIAFTERYKIPSSVVYFDLDDFKEVNDTFGHAAGDAALTHFTELLLANIRESDVAGRLGGDEFAVILPNARLKSAQGKAASLSALVKRSPAIWQGQAIALSCSTGVCDFRPGESAQEALARADQAMYAEKRARDPGEDEGGKT
jgi:diguanylate cyclase (GGDEF)-like protein